MRIHHGASVAAVMLSVYCGWELEPALAQQPYVSDPDPSRPMLHVQPPAVPQSSIVLGPTAPSTVINGITIVDVATLAGLTLVNRDYGNEPAITANPLNPNQIVLTSFSGSDWPNGGNSSLFYSGDAGASWTYSVAVPPPPGTTGNFFCPCDQNMDWGRNGVLYGTFLHVATDGTQSVYSAQATNPTDPSSWIYRAPGGVSQRTNQDAFIDVDQPWLWSGPLPGDNSVTNVCVAYDNFDAGFINAEIRAADSPGASPLDFTRDAPTDADSLQYGDGMNPGNRIAVGPDGTIFNLYQRLVSVQAGGVKQLTYLINVSTDGGQTWSVANSDHPSGAKIVAANVLSFQGNGSKIGGVNALLGGVDAITVDPATGVAWVVYGARPTQTDHDQLYLVPVTYSAGNLTLGTTRTLTSITLDNYLPSVAVLPNGEVGVLFLTLSGTSFQWRFVQWTNGTTIAKTTGLGAFTSPFSNNGVSNQRIFGDYIQVRAVGCGYYGTYPARGTPPPINSTSIDPYFMSAPSATTCTLPTATALVPSVTCAGAGGLNLAIQGTGFSAGATGRIQAQLRNTTFDSPTQVTMAVQAADIAAPGVAIVDLLGAAPAGGLTGTLPLTLEAPAASPGATLLASPGGGNVNLSWDASSGATSYAVRRCDATLGSCTPVTIATPALNAYPDGVLADGNSYWYLIDAVNSCGAVP
jgi:hypothetical protein